MPKRRLTKDHRTFICYSYRMISTGQKKGCLVEGRILEGVAHAVGMEVATRARPKVAVPLPAPWVVLERERDDDVSERVS